jgi:hypothetical protein
LCCQCSCFSRFHLFLLPFLVWAPAAAPPLQGYKLYNKSDRVWVNYRYASPSPSAALPSRPPTRPGITVMPARRPPRPRSRCPRRDAPSPRTCTPLVRAAVRRMQCRLPVHPCCIRQRLLLLGERCWGQDPEVHPLRRPAATFIR